MSAVGEQAGRMNGAGGAMIRAIDCVGLVNRVVIRTKEPNGLTREDAADILAEHEALAVWTKVIDATYAKDASIELTADELATLTAAVDAIAPEEVVEKAAEPAQKPAGGQDDVAADDGADDEEKAAGGAGEDTDGDAITITTYASVKDEIGTLETLSRDDFFDRLLTHKAGTKEGAGFTPARFVDNHRKVVNAIERTLYVFDVEQLERVDRRTGEVIRGPAPPPPTDTIARIEEKGWAGLVYTSHSHTKERPRYRVVLRMDEPFHFGEGAERAERIALDRHMAPIFG